MMDAEVFTIRQDEWQVRLGALVLPTIWNSRGAAIAGMKTEMRRRAIDAAKCRPQPLDPDTEAFSAGEQQVSTR